MNGADTAWIMVATALGLVYDTAWIGFVLWWISKSKKCSFCIYAVLCYSLFDVNFMA